MHWSRLTLSCFKGWDYGQQIFASLPAMRKTRDEQTVLTFIKELALQHETTCD